MGSTHTHHSNVQCDVCEERHDVGNLEGCRDLLKEQLDVAIETGQSALDEIARLREEVATLRPIAQQRDDAVNDLLTIRQDNQYSRQENASLRERVKELEGANKRWAERYAKLNGDLDARAGGHDG